MKFSLKTLALLASTLALTATTVVYAQQGGGFGMDGGPGFGGRHGMGGGMGMAGPEGGNFAAGRLAQLKTELKITPAQDAAWNAFETAVTQQRTAMLALRGQMQTQMHTPQADGKTTDFQALRTSMRALREAGQASIHTAYQDLYAALTPEQKAIADQRRANRAGRGDHFGGRPCAS